MKRIYQGRVTAVQTAADGKKDLQPLNQDSGQARRLGEEMLWEHHARFQDAANNHVVCQRALAGKERTPHRTPNLN